MAEPVWRDCLQPPRRRAEALLAEMTLAEKLAQLGSAWLDNDGGNGGEMAPMQDVIAGGGVSLEQAREHGIGHLTRVFGTCPVNARDGAAKVAELQEEIVAASRLGVPAIVHEECLTGFTTFGATVYPTALAWAATFDPDLVGRMANAIGRDMRDVGVHQGLSPVLDVVRDYRWGRVEETLGEDPYLAAMLGTAYVEGLERNGVVATLKHFAGYSASRAARNHAPVSIGQRELRDVLLPPFEMAIRDGHARSVMNAYVDLDGVPAAANRPLLTGVLREEWGFDGVVVSDYWAVAFLQSMHGVATSPGHAGALALSAGIDVELPETLCYGKELHELVVSGEVPESIVDCAVLRLLTQKAELGLLDKDWPPAPAGAAGARSEVELDSAANRDLARELAEQSIVLLADDGQLPLREQVGSIALVGPCADDPLTFMGCYSYPNHVLQRHPELGIGVAAPSLAEAMRDEFPDSAITAHTGCPIRERDRSSIPDAVAAARQADVCVAVVGDRAGLFDQGTSGEGCDAADLRLPGAQDELVRALLATSTPVVLVVVSGRPYALGAYAGEARAVIQSFMPGEEGGAALAGVLSGRVTPSGRLPVGIPRAPGGQPATYLHPPLGGNTEGISNLDPAPLYPFGHGLSYTRFEYGKLRLDADRIDTGGEVSVSVEVRNVGERAATETAQLYVHDVTAQVARPVRQLTGFARVTLAPQGCARVTFRLHADRTAFTGVDLRRIVEPGTIEVYVGRSSTDLPCAGSFELTGPVREVGNGRVLTTPAEVRLL